jgi:RNA-splicing ligase RtcB
MFRINEGGKEGVVFLSEDEVKGDASTLKQIKQMITDPTVDHARIMPDCHAATSCCVGFTARLTNKVVPRFVGGDIGCGITVLPLGPIADRATARAKQLSDRIRACVPAGEAARDAPMEGELDAVCAEAAVAAAAFARDHPGD